MNITLNRRGETLIESLISMLIIAMTTAMLTMAVANVLRSYSLAERTPTFAYNSAQNTMHEELGGSYTVKLEWDSPTSDSVTRSVTMHKENSQTPDIEGVLYYYVPEP